MLGGRRAGRDFHPREGPGGRLCPQPGQPPARPPGTPSPFPPAPALLILQAGPAAGSVRHPESPLEILQHQGKSSKGSGGSAGIGLWRREPYSLPGSSNICLCNRISGLSALWLFSVFKKLSFLTIGKRLGAIVLSVHLKH